MIYISDLDNTLLNDDCILSDYSRQTLNELIKDGVQFSVASARSVVSMQKILGGLSLNLPIIEFNGAFISEFASGRHIVTNAIDSLFLTDLLAAIRNSGNEPFLSTFNGTMDKLYSESIINDGMKWYLDDRIKFGDRRLISNEQIERHLTEQVVCFTIINRKENLIALKQTIEEQFGSQLEVLLMENFYSKGWYWLTLHNSKATKDNAVCQLAEMQGHDLTEIVVFGDNQNDLSMFKIASKAIAVRNATVAVKELANEMIGSNNEDSVAKYILNEYHRLNVELKQ